MSFFEKIVLKTFLILALICFSFSAFAATTHVFYKDLTGSDQCSSVYSAFCATAFSRVPRMSGYRYVQEGCDYFGYSEINVRYSETPPSYNSTGLYYDDATKSINHVTSAEKMTHSCPSGQTFILEGCTPKCVLDDPCLAKKDQIVKLEELCGLSQCPTGSTFNSSGICKKANGTTVPAQQVLNVPSSGQTGDFDGCEVISLDTPDAGSKGYYKNTDTGKQDLSTYCPVNYKYTGNKSNNSGAQNGLPASTTSPSANDKPTLPDSLYYPDNESCKPGDSHGQYGVGDSMVDVCSKGSNNDNGQQGCPVGEIRNNQGDCVPYKDATKCPNDAIRDNMGNCPTSPNNGGGSGGSCTISGQTQVNGTCQCPSGQTVQNGSCAATGSGDSNNNGGDSGGSCTISGQTKVNGTCQCPTGQTVKDNKCTSSSSNGNEASNGAYTGSRKCEEAPQCEGDVHLCGLMTEQYKAKCETLEAITGVTDDEKSKYDEVGTDSGDSRVKASTDSLNSYANQVKSLLAVNSPASCPADISISLLKHSFVLPISQVCPLFVLMRYLLALLVDLACLRILYKSFVGD